MDPAALGELGNSGLVVSRLGLGTAPIGGMYTPVSGEDARGAVQEALDRGLRFFDTAPLYGHGVAERRLGQAVAHHRRDDVVVATKVGRLLRPGTVDGGIFTDVPPVGPVFDFSRDGVRTSLFESLERLKLDRVDLLHVHDPDEHEAQASSQALPALLELKSHGVIRAVGAGMNQTAMLTRFVRAGLVDCVLVAGRYTLLDQSALDDLLPACAQRGVGVIAAGVFNSGILADPRPGAPYDYSAAPAKAVQQAQQIAAVCERHGTSLRTAALQFPALHPAVGCVLTGARSRAEVAENVGRFAEPVPSALWDALRSAGLLRADAPPA